MNYPNVTLKIKNNLATIELHKNENTSKQVVKASKGIDTALFEVASLISISDYESAEDLFNRAREGDERTVEFGEISYDKDQIDFSKLIEVVNQEQNNYQVHPDVTKQAVADQLGEYWKTDVLASFIEEMYNILIARTFYLASEMAVDHIVLADDRQETRLREKLTKELGSVEEIELEIVS